jgi:heptose I phosphotransferase
MIGNQKIVSILSLPSQLISFFGSDPFEKIMHLNGRVFRDVPGRKTIQVTLGESHCFVKQHFGVGWAEIFKSLISLKKPVTSALTEVHAIERLTAIGISTTPLIGYGQQGINPAKLQSFVMTEDLGDIISLESLCVNWKNEPPDAEFKNQLMLALGQLAAKLHGAGLCHRDFYLCHFVLKKSELAQGQMNLILIDLHRMLTEQKLNGTAVMKDIAGLVFSAKDCGFDQDDWAIFKQHYLKQTEDFWLKVDIRANQLYAKFHSDKFQKRLKEEKSAID